MMSGGGTSKADRSKKMNSGNFGGAFNTISELQHSNTAPMDSFHESDSAAEEQQPKNSYL